MTSTCTQRRMDAIKCMLRRAFAKPEKMDSFAFTATFNECVTLATRFPRLLTSPEQQVIAQDGLLFSGNHCRRFSACQLLAITQAALSLAVLSTPVHELLVREAFALEQAKLTKVDPGALDRAGAVVISASVLAFLQDIHLDPIEATALYLEDRS